MKKLLLIAALMVPFATASADPREHHDRDHHEWHERGSHFGWGEFVGGLILGGIGAHEINGHYYNEDDDEVRRVTICRDVIVYDQWNHPVYDNWGRMITERRCHDEWVRVNR